MIDIIKEAVIYVLSTLVHNAPSLILGIIIASAIKVYIDPEKFKSTLIRRANISIPGSVAFGTFTPFCACGTMAVVVSMLTTALPWGTIMAFLTSSPLMSPDEFIMISGIISFKFAVALTAASIIIGLAAGYITHYIEKNTHFLDNQARFSETAAKSRCSCAPDTANNVPVSSCSNTANTSGYSLKSNYSCCSDETAVTAVPSFVEKYKLRELLDTIIDVGFKKVLLFFSIFAAVGFFINKFVPASLITILFGGHNIFSVPLSAIFGLPLYVSGPSALPVIKTLMDSGASGGAMLAFMITGPGTSAGAVAGIATIMKRKALLLYVAFILAGGIILGYAYDLLLMLIW